MISPPPSQPWWWAPPPSTTNARSRPFANFSGDPEQEFFADGITEDIISLLAGWRAFPVIARDSTFTFKGKTVDIKKVGEQLDARYIVEGSVRKSGQRIRITAQLIRADTGHHIMVERFDRGLTELFELQDEITRIIAGALEPELLKFERNRIASQPQHNEDAHELYQRGMFHHYRHNKADNIEAQAYFRRALAIDGQYAQATVALAMVVCNAAYLGWAENPEGNYKESFELVQRGLALDGRYPNAHFVLGGICMWTNRADRAIAAFQEAMKLNPSFAAAHVLLGQMYLYSGRLEEAIAMAENGIRQRPPPVHLASRARRRSLSAWALCPGGRSRTAVLDPRPPLASGSHLRCCWARPARADRGGEGCTRRPERARPEPFLCPDHTAAALYAPTRDRSHSRRPAQGRV